MFGEEKNLKDTQRGSVKDTSSIAKSQESSGFRLGSYNKLHKLVTALYMVTDIMDKEEPLKNKLRTLSIELISDIHLTPTQLGDKVYGIVSFLEIASAMNFISEMNCSILKKEFIELKSSIEESLQVKPIWLEDFLKDSSLPPLPKGYSGRGELNSPPERLTSFSRAGKGHTSIGVQKGSTLMKALSGIKDIHKNNPAPYEAEGFRSRFNELKEQRRLQIISIIKSRNNNTDPDLRGTTIKDIKNRAEGALASCGEKTLQRELISMVKDGVLNKTGEKRWSRYFVK